MSTITYNRDTSKDIIPPIQILIDSQGRVLSVDGKALKPYTPTTPNVTYYAWYTTRGDIDFPDGLCFTLNETPSVGDTLYCKSGSDIVVSPYTVYAYDSTYNTIDCYAGSFSYSRKSSEDVVVGDELINPVVLTDSLGNVITYNGNVVLVEQIQAHSLTFTISNPSRGGTITINGTNYSITDYIDGSYAVISQTFAVGSEVSFTITSSRFVTISDSTNTTCIPNTQNMYSDPANDRTYTFNMPNENVSCSLNINIEKW